MDSKKIGMNKSALIVDDEEELRDAISYDFNKKGFTVYTSSDGNEAIKILKSQKIDVVVSDIQMPDCDGICLLKKINELPTMPIFLLMTGFSSYDKNHVKKLGATDLISKPINRKEMFRIIEEALQL